MPKRTVQILFEFLRIRENSQTVDLVNTDVDTVFQSSTNDTIGTRVRCINRALHCTTGAVILRLEVKDQRANFEIAYFSR